jgi:serine protease SohB
MALVPQNLLPARLTGAPLVAVIRLEGVIGSAGRFGGPSLTDAGLAPLIERAFARGKPKAVALAVNSPGGSAAQSSLIAARIRRLADRHKVPVHAFCEDVAASGGYWLATAADHIWADDSSILGSIGVISAGFGFSDLIQRYGVERRLHTAGERKSLLDPFRPERPEDVERLHRLLASLHANFIAHVKARRGDRLAGDNLFTGEVFVGRDAVAAGLADGLAHLVPKMQELFGDRVRFSVIRQRQGLFRRFGLELATDAIASFEDRAQWMRYGL